MFSAGVTRIDLVTQTGPPRTLPKNALDLRPRYGMLPASAQYKNKSWGSR
jgi:hypothetical protein